MREMLRMKSTGWEYAEPCLRFIFNSSRFSMQKVPTPFGDRNFWNIFQTVRICHGHARLEYAQNAAFPCFTVFG